MDVTALWCSLLPALTGTQSPTGRANDQARVDGVRERYSRELMGLPGVIALGTTRLSARSQTGKAPPPPSSQADDHAIFIGVEDESYAPEARLFLEGLPIVVRVTGRFTARAGPEGSSHSRD